MFETNEDARRKISKAAVGLLLRFSEAFSIGMMS